MSKLQRNLLIIVAATALLSIAASAMNTANLHYSLTNLQAHLVTAIKVFFAIVLSVALARTCTRLIVRFVLVHLKNRV